ncbi:putative basic amino acid antiporter YfcC [Pseudomarimonas arenosa]|uniref:Basic amino acid antiporter YfcC n=1 Tax=Pseudomarimonas arenosa TaxID=2774145 RepID=A0AAW3ZL54_9GAMM|nr:putative basic amino acid antiporter YfcC [Pseudomarimonas arenosa]MBD8525797.1 putative basic amino acid antiporter YfcC [Pseudomarimonas arenosa]
MNTSDQASKTPHTLLILLAGCLLVALLAPWLPAGEFLPDQPIALESYRHSGQRVATTLFAADDSQAGLINALFEGFTSGDRSSAAIGVIAFVLLVGGAFGVVRASGAMDRAVLRLADRAERSPRLLLAALFIAFSLGGAVFGMGEETIAFLALLLPLLLRLGLPAEVGVMVTYMASQIGFATSWMNPFSVAVAQGIAGLPLLSGAPLRIVMYVCFVAISLGFVLWYASRHRQTIASAQQEISEQRGLPLQGCDWIILLSVLATVIWIIWGVVAGGYYIPQIASQFVALGLVAGLVAVLSGRIRANEAAEAFVRGVQDLIPAALVIAMAKGLLYLLGGSDPHQPSLLNSLLHSMGSLLQGWPELAAAEGMLLVQSIFNFFVTSGSAQAAITMPLMAGLGDLVGVSRQVSVLAFQLGDGLTNLVVPTSAALMGALGVAGVPWPRWVALIWRFQLLLMGLAASAVAIAVLTGFQ